MNSPLADVRTRMLEAIQATTTPEALGLSYAMLLGLATGDEWWIPIHEAIRTRWPDRGVEAVRSAGWEARALCGFVRSSGGSSAELGPGAGGSAELGPGAGGSAELSASDRFRAAALDTIRRHFEGGDRRALVWGWRADGQPATIHGAEFTDAGSVDATMIRMIKHAGTLGVTRWATAHIEPGRETVHLVLIEDEGWHGYEATLNGLGLSAWAVTGYAATKCRLCGATGDQGRAFLSNEVCAPCLTPPSIEGLAFAGNLVVRMRQYPRLWAAITVGLDPRNTDLLMEAMAWLAGLSQRIDHD